MTDRLIVPSGMSRRHFLGHMATTALAVPAMQFFASLEANAQQLRKNEQEAASCSGWAAAPATWTPGT